MGVETGVLLGMMAGGNILSFEQTRQQQKMAQYGQMVSDAQFKASLEGIRAQAAQDSLAEVKQLRETLGTQIAMQAAMGTATGAGSAASMLMGSLSAEAQDKRMRRLNQMIAEGNLSGQHRLQTLQNLQTQQQLMSGFTQNMFNQLSPQNISYMMGKL
jgi:hypothetical protein